MAEGAEPTLGTPFLVRFWGVRGSIATPGPETVRYGGNTSCLEVRCGDRLIVLDAGTGLRALGGALAGQAPMEADLFLTHTHFDHVCGLPFFKPFFDPRNRWRLWAGHLGGTLTLHRVLRELMMAPLFPVPPEVFKAAMAYRDFSAGETLSPASGIAIRTCPLNHPDGATGYRIDFAGRSLCYVTDTEHTPGVPDRRVLDLIAGADLVVYDCMYTDEAYARGYAGWGHSTWEEGVRLCQAAGVRRLAVFHHDPERNDAQLDAIGQAARAAMPGAFIATEGGQVLL